MSYGGIRTWEFYDDVSSELSCSIFMFCLAFGFMEGRIDGLVLITCYGKPHDHRLFSRVFSAWVRGSLSE